MLAESGPSGTASEPEPSGHISLYVVRDGDTLSQIAGMFSVTVNTIRWANDISPSSSIHPGQTLTILPITGVRHEVEKGDTLASIAKKYDGDLEEILNYNNLHADAELAVGDVVIIPDGEITTSHTSYTSSGSSSGGSTSSSVPTYSGYYLRPIRGGIRTQGIHGYNAVDLATSAGSPIFAAADGDVVISKNAGWNGGYGNYVAIRHDNGTQTLYAHMTNTIVYVGQHVVQGQVIGYVGATGRATGPHVHFEIRGAQNPF